LSCAAILDPRCNVKFVEYCFNKLFAPDEGMERIDNVFGALCSLYDEYKLHSSLTSPIVSSSSTVSGFGMIILMIIIVLVVEDLEHK